MNRAIAAITCACVVLLTLLGAPRVATHSTATVVVPILMYHHVGNWGPARPDWAPWVVLPEDFRAQMDWLVQHGYRTISFRELIECSSRGVAPVGKPVIISFDDGWTSQCTCAPDAAAFTTQPRSDRAPSPTERAG